MSFFSKTEIKDLKANNERIIRIAVSNVPINPTIAITTSNKIHLYNQSGQKHQYELSRSITPTCIEWHPSSPILAIGWDNGRITIWNEDTKAPKQEGKPHSDPIMMIRFNPSGSRMVTSDLTGTIGVWRGINLLSVYQKQWAITHCVFCDIQLEGAKGNLGNLFLFAGRSGTVCLANDMNMCSDVCRVGGTIKALMFYQKEGSAIVITSNLLLVQFKINFTQKSVPQKKVKLSISGQPQNLNSIWIGQSLLSTCSNQNMIRFWHLQQDQNYNLTVFDVLSSDNNSGMNLGTDKISSIIYDSRGRSLVAGTREGRLMFWKNMALGTDSPIDKDQWAPQQYINLNKQIQLLTVGKNNGVIVCKQNDGQVIIVSETRITGKISGNYRAVLKTSELVQVIYDDNKQKLSQNFPTMGHIKGIDLYGDKLLYWNNKSIQIVQINKDVKLYKQVLSKLEQKPLKCLFANKESFLITTDFGFNQMTLQGQLKQTFNFPQSQGKVLGIQLMGSSLVLWTQSSYIRVFQVSSEIKQLGNSRRFQDSKGLIGNIRACSANANGKKISIVSNKESSAANHSFHIYDIDSDSFISHELGSQKIPISIFWDLRDPRYMGVQVQSSKTVMTKDNEETDQSQNDADTQQGQEDSEDKQKVTTRQFLTFFYTTQTGIKYQDKYLLKPSILDIFALRVPFFYSVQRNKQQITIKKTTLHDFYRINHEDDIIKSSILNFSFYLTSGNLDEAYKSVKNIQNSAIWQKMAIMCVKCKRLDVAQICIGNMKFARGARSIRQAKKEKQAQAQLGMVAIQLNMIEQAKQSYEQCKRFDLLSRVCQANGQIEEAISIAQKHDRINLRNAFYNAAKYYQASNKHELAIEFYERSNTHIKQVPRMMLEGGKINELTDYINNKKDKKLYTWLGQYSESIGNLEEAFGYYKEGQSTSNLVRLHLSQNQLQESIKTCNSESEPQACFLLARHMQKNGMLSQAIHFYAKAQYYSQAVKIAITNGLDGQIMSLSMAAPKQVAARSANYFERKGFIEKAIRLYKKAGAIKKANRLAEKNGFTQLISMDAPEEQSDKQEDAVIGGDKAAITARVNQLVEAGKFDRAVPLLVNLKQYEKALEICIQHNVSIQEQLVKKMLPDEEPTNPVQKAKRVELTKTIAQKCRRQGSFQLASNLYVKLADKIKALKCLIQLGDAQKVMMFANNARGAQTWILAANFLQTGDWHQNSQLMKNIIQFYSKAKAYENLSSFFQACSNVQIDEYRDYDKAVGALKEAIKHMSKSTSGDRQAKTSNLTYKKQLIEKFIQLRDLAQSNPQQMIASYLQFLQEPDIQQTIRRGDIFAIVIQYYFQTQQYEKCFNYLKEMKQRGIIITPYIDKQIIDGVYKALGITTKKKDQIQEEVIQDIS